MFEEITSAPNAISENKGSESTSGCGDLGSGHLQPQVDQRLFHGAQQARAQGVVHPPAHAYQPVHCETERGLRSQAEEPGGPSPHPGSTLNPPGLCGL